MIRPTFLSSLRHRVRAAVVAFAVTALAFSSAPTLADSSPPDFAQRQVGVMTQNLYLGADLTPLFGKSGADLIIEAAKVYARMEQTNFPARAESIAREIFQKGGPPVIGLQEVALWKKGSDPEHLQTTFDFLAIMLDALAQRGLHYDAVAVNVNVSVALPIALDLKTWASFTDRDAIIARADLQESELQWSNPTEQNFQAKLPVPIGDEILMVPRGWSTVDVRFRGKSYRAANTHLEAFSVDVRNAQARELAASLAASPLPVVLLGDLNSFPNDPTGSYAIILSVGFTDSWIQAMDGDPGNTAGQDLDCTIPSGIDHKVDYVLHNQNGFVDAVVGSGDIVGEEDADCTDTDPPLRPSDHAGVVLSMHIASP
jgi:endonuclease/exonuclease/phosphatase family metal-dependent hydrolase